MTLKSNRIERTEPLKIAGELVTRIIRQEYEYHGRELTLELGRKCLEGATDDQIMRIADGRAELIGVSPNVLYREVKP